MTATLTTSPAPSVRVCTPEARVTKSLLGYGVLAGPCYVTVSLAQALAHKGFDLTRHDWSLLAAGPWGWIQSGNLLLTGLMVIACSVGLARTRVSRVAPWLVGVFGLGMVGGGVMTADPWGGYPIGAPATTTLSWHGAGHMIAGLIGFAALIVAAFVLAQRFSRDGMPSAAWGSRAVGAAFLAGMVGVSSGSTAPVITLGFTASVLAVWVWLAAVAVHLYRRTLAEGAAHRR